MFYVCVFKAVAWVLCQNLKERCMRNNKCVSVCGLHIRHTNQKNCITCWKCHVNAESWNAKALLKKCRNAEKCNKLPNKERKATVKNCIADEPWRYNIKQAEVVSNSFCWGKKRFDRKQEVEMDLLLKSSMKVNSTL